MNYEQDRMIHELQSLDSADIIKFKSILAMFNQKQTTEVKLKDFSEEYLEYGKSIFSQKYLHSIDISLKHLLRYFSPERLLSTIKLRNTEDFIYMLQKGAPKGYKVYHRTIKAAFNKALEWEYISENPFSKVRLQKQQMINPVYLTVDDLERILSCTPAIVHRNIIKFAFYSGCRIGEIVNLRWQNVNFVNRILTIGDKEFTTKSRKQRMVPICNELLSVLSGLYESRNINSSYVFAKSNGFPFTTEYISKKFKASCRKVGMDESVHFHSLLHSFSSNLVQNGVSILTLKELLGHSSVSVTERYSHVNMNTLIDAVNVFNRAA